MKKYKLPVMKKGGYLKNESTYVTKDGKETQRGLWSNVYLKKKREGKLEEGGIVGDPPENKNKSFSFDGRLIPIRELEMKGLFGNLDFQKKINENIYANAGIDGIYGEINESPKLINFFNANVKGGFGAKSLDNTVGGEIGFTKSISNPSDPSLYTRLNFGGKKYNVDLEANLPTNQNQIKPILIGNASFRPDENTDINLEGSYDFNLNQPNIRAGVVRRFAEGGIVDPPPNVEPNEEKRIEDLKQQFNIQRGVGFPIFPESMSLKKKDNLGYSNNEKWTSKGYDKVLNPQGSYELILNSLDSIYNEGEKIQVQCGEGMQCAGQSNTQIERAKQEIYDALSNDTKKTLNLNSLKDGNIQYQRGDAWLNRGVEIWTDPEHKKLIDDLNKTDVNVEAWPAKSTTKELPASLFEKNEYGSYDLVGATVHGMRDNDKDKERTDKWAKQHKGKNLFTQHQGTVVGLVQNSDNKNQMVMFIEHGYASKDTGSKTQIDRVILEKNKNGNYNVINGWGYGPDENRYEIKAFRKDADLIKLQNAYNKENTKQVEPKEETKKNITITPVTTYSPTPIKIKSSSPRVTDYKLPPIRLRFQRYGGVSLKYGGIVSDKSFCPCNYKKIN